MQSVIADNPPTRSVALAPMAAGTCLAAMSGGVDSAVATALAVRAGVDAVGITMRLWSPGPGPLNEKVRQCCGPTAYADAKSAAEVAGIPHYIVNFEAAFSRAVVDYFCREYLAGRTPNPCVACNNLVKFGALLDFARALGAVTLVTGHYARVFVDDRGPHLLRAVDRSKDQSYMLAGLRPDQLASIIMPLGEYAKEQTRAVARELGLDVAEKPDSVDLCFVGGDYRSFIAERYPESAAAGPMRTIDGHEVGRHNGLLGYTVGQRKGLPDTLRDGPWYVLRTDRDTNAVVIGHRDDLARRSVTCSAANIIRSERFAGGVAPGLAVCRYRSRGVPARARAIAAGLSVDFDEPVSLLTPGQLLVLYDETDQEVLASGIIEP
ncbi:MAG: tRNA 2-thiouridine(34) synthase MnmA [Candidatus Eremiobacteraeota bacterium]|nr:tRNA 2-thiouridine(34) synthase MnmA [Candidatus Eremiobacteraeota bacterium]